MYCAFNTSAITLLVVSCCQFSAVVKVLLLDFTLGFDSLPEAFGWLTSFLVLKEGADEAIRYCFAHFLDTVWKVVVCIPPLLMVLRSCFLGMAMKPVVPLAELLMRGRVKPWKVVSSLCEARSSHGKSCRPYERQG